MESFSMSLNNLSSYLSFYDGGISKVINAATICFQHGPEVSESPQHPQNLRSVVQVPCTLGCLVTCLVFSFTTFLPNAFLSRVACNNTSSGVIFFTHTTRWFLFSAYERDIALRQKVWVWIDLKWINSNHNFTALKLQGQTLRSLGLTETSRISTGKSNKCILRECCTLPRTGGAGFKHGLACENLKACMQTSQWDGRGRCRLASVERGHWTA